MVWGSGLNDKQIRKIERCEKIAFSVILRTKVDRFNYSEVLTKLGLESVTKRRELALVKFGRKLLLNKRFRYFLPQFNSSEKSRCLRSKSAFIEPLYKHDRYKKSTIPQLIKIVNEEFKNKGTIYSYTFKDIVYVADGIDIN